ncbi:MAG: pyridoxal phosphate-dependent aminotransferase [Candidatus Dormibacteraceae bacterium]
MRTSSRLESFTESVIREMTRLNLELNGSERAVNFAQGFPDFAPPPGIVAAAHDALDSDPSFHQYSTTWGTPSLRRAVARLKEREWGQMVDPETMVTVACGATESMIAAMLAVVDDGDEVIIFEPHYENYGPDCVLTGGRPRHVLLRPPRWEFDPDELAAAFGPKTRAIVINTPHNPTGKVFSREELMEIARLCQKHDVVAITDEIYERLVYEGEHVSLATLPGMRERTITISGASKTYSVTGWRVGWLVAPPDLTNAIRKVHDFLTVGAPHPLQIAVAAALRSPDSFYTELRAEYRERRDRLVAGLRECGFTVDVPSGAYYVMAGIASLTSQSDVDFALRLIRECGVATVPGSSFYDRREMGRKYLRFSYPKQIETIDRGLQALRSHLA